MNNNISLSIIPIISYYNAEEFKKLIYSQNRGKSGIYRWTNKVTNKSYIGSGVDLTRRLGNYYSLPFLNREVLRHQSLIYKAVLKYGISNFSLEILEYCDVKSLIKKEQYYMDLLKPEYNILKIAGSPLGRRLKQETKNKLSQKN